MDSDFVKKEVFGTSIVAELPVVPCIQMMISAALDAVGVQEICQIVALACFGMLWQAIWDALRCPIRIKCPLPGSADLLQSSLVFDSLPCAGLLWFAVSAIPSHPTKLPSEWEPERKAFEHTLGGK